MKPVSRLTNSSAASRIREDARQRRESAHDFVSALIERVSRLTNSSGDLRFDEVERLRIQVASASELV